MQEQELIGSLAASHVRHVNAKDQRPKREREVRQRFAFAFSPAAGLLARLLHHHHSVAKDPEPKGHQD
jgi:hypothetical protein